MLFWSLWLRGVFCNNNCVNPPNTRLLDNQMRRLQWHFHSHYDSINVSLENFVDDALCHQTSITDDTLYNYRAMCPWTYVSDTDENRYPMRLNVAKCGCSTCADNFQCKPVVYSIPILKKECRNGVNRWLQKMQYIPVACYCSNPPFRNVRQILN